MARKRFTPKFKNKVVPEALKERHSLVELAQKYEIYPTQTSVWKYDLLDGAEQAFESGKKDALGGTEGEKDKLLKAIGRLKVNNAFFKDAFCTETTLRTQKNDT